MKPVQRLVLGAVVAFAILGAIVGCDGMFTTEINLEDNTVAVAGVSVYPKSLTVDVANSVNDLEAEVVPSNASNQLIHWESSDESVVTVDAAGVLSAVFPGTATITVVTDEGSHTETATVHVSHTGPAGGFVFYRDEAGKHDWTYLEAAPPETEWTEKPWGGAGIEVGASAQGDEVGDGAANSAAIVAAFGDQEPTDNREDYAARLADELEYVHEAVAYDDWFLPSRGELSLMYENLHAAGVGGFNDEEFEVYWSSSETNSNTAKTVSFLHGTGAGTISHNKSNFAFRVRAIRAF